MGSVPQSPGREMGKLPQGRLAVKWESQYLYNFLVFYLTPFFFFSNYWLFGLLVDQPLFFLPK